MAIMLKPDVHKIKFCLYIVCSILIFVLLLLVLQARDQDSITIRELIRGPLKQDDSRIISYILRNNYLNPPSVEPYELNEPNMDPSMGQSSIILKIFNKLKNGFFVECGALDGETRSNTLVLEKKYGWEGLLVEGDPSNYKLLLKKNRKAWTAGCCLAVHPYPHEVLYLQDFNTGGIKVDNVHEIGERNDSVVQVQCFPLFSLLRSLGVFSVDYFSLDVEGNELEVLRTIPFEQVHIKVLSVEFTHGPGGSVSLEEFMRTKNYRVVTRLVHKRSYANDLIFVRNDFPLSVNFPQVIQSKKAN